MMVDGRLDMNSSNHADESTNNNESFDKDISKPKSKEPKYPLAVFFILITEFCERFSYSGMRTVLTLYLRNVLNFSEDLSTTCYHVFLLLCYGLPVFGGILADNYLGKYKTILYLCIVYIIGNITLSVSSVPPFHLPVIPLTLLGLLLIAIGTGGIKPCVVSLGAEQFVLPAQEKSFRHFFAIFSFIVNIGTLLSVAISPIFRRDVSCFGDDTCYSLAFGFPASLMFVGIIVFLSGRCLYKMVEPHGNILVKVVKCISYALCEKFKNKPVVTQAASPVSAIVDGQDKTVQRRQHWLDNARNKYDKKLVEDTKGLLRVLVYFLPVPMFFALYEQLGSRWTFQATRMDGVVGPLTIKPDQMLVANSVLMLTLIPVSEVIVYPLCRKCGLLKRPLQRMCIGGLFAAMSFALAGIVELKIESSSPSNLPRPGTMNLNLMNTAPCPVTIERQNHQTSSASEDHLRSKIVISNGNNHIIPLQDGNDTHSFLIQLGFPVPDNNTMDIDIHSSTIISNASLSSTCAHRSKQMTTMLTLTDHLETEDARGIFKTCIISEHNGTLAVTNLPGSDDLKKSKEGNAKIRFVFDSYCDGNVRREMAARIRLISLSSQATLKKDFMLNPLPNDSYSGLLVSKTFEVEPDKYKVVLEKGLVTSTMEEFSVEGSVDLKNGGSYLYVLKYEDGTSCKKLSSQMTFLTPPNKIHMLWLLPQYILMVCGEVLFIISGSEFSFTEAPESMKSVMQACWHLMNAVGNAIVIVSAQFRVDEATGFFTFAGLMVIDVIIFAVLSSKYKYVTPETAERKCSILSSAPASLRSKGKEKMQFPRESTEEHEKETHL